MYFSNMKISNSKDIQLQYKGFLNTPLLWENDAIFGLKQLIIDVENTPQYNSFDKPEIRLGKRVEQFSFFTFQQDKTIQIQAKNIQIQDENRTVGELDCLLSKNNQQIHVEIIYKFYLYDSTVGNHEIEKWIGPNRRDSFYQKLTKLKNKQLPLLYSNFTKSTLNKLNFSTKNCIQNVFFKAQLFVPFKIKNNFFELINNKCIVGFYVSHQELSQFKECKFYIPTKINWLKEVQLNVNWIHFSTFQKQINAYINEQNSPLCWIKYPNGNTQKFFVVWW